MKSCLSTLAAVLCLAPLCTGQSSSPWKGKISGTISDEDGHPVAGWHAAAVQWEYHRGRKQLSYSPGEVSTKDDGTFEIENLDPGEYLLRAEQPYLFQAGLGIPRPPVRPAPKTTGEVYVTTYFPGALNADSAQIIHVTAGGTAAPIRFRLKHARVFRIAGRFVGPSGFTAIKLINSSDPNDTRPVRTGVDGRFHVDGLLAGTYVITSSSERTIFTLTDHDLTDLTINANPCPKVTGTITLDGLPTVPKTVMGPIVPLTLLDQAVTIYGQVDAKGSFTVACVPPEYYSTEVVPGPGQYLKSITLHGKDVTNGPLDLSSPRDKKLDIALSSGASELSGAVRDASGNLQPGNPVTIWSGDFNLTVTSAANGVFQIPNLPPGTYRVAAWDQLYVQPSGWGVTTVREFRNDFEAASGSAVVNKGQTLRLDPPLIPRASIEKAASELHLHARMNVPMELDAIGKAVRSPATLSRFLSTSQTVDWTLLRRALGLDDAKFWLAPCAGDFIAASSPCSVETINVPNSEQALLIVRGDQLAKTVEYLRFTRISKGQWQFAGESSAYQANSESKYRLMKFGNKPFLAISSDHSQTGMATQQVLEEWFDLTHADFKPVFSFTPDGGQGRFGFGVGRGIKATCAFSQTTAQEKIDVTLKIDLNGVGLDQPATYTGVYMRRAAENAFTLRSATIPLKDFEELADPFSGLSNEKLLKYAFPGLEKIAKGSNREATEWLKSILNNAKDTPEKQALLKLLKP